MPFSNTGPSRLAENGNHGHARSIAPVSLLNLAQRMTLNPEVQSKPGRSEGVFSAGSNQLTGL